MSRVHWRALARKLLRLANTTPPGPIPARVETDLWAATETRIAAARRTPWF